MQPRSRTLDGEARPDLLPPTRGDYRASYGMGYATAATPTGMAYSAFAKSPLNPVLRETSAVLSPGGGC